MNRFAMATTITTVALAFSGCAGADYMLVGSPMASGADGEIQVEKIDGSNLMVSVLLEHLLPPERVDSAMNHYAMWFVAEDRPAVKMGKLEYDKDERKGTIMATTPLRNFELRITAESDEAASTLPSGSVIARQRIKE